MDSFIPSHWQDILRNPADPAYEGRAERKPMLLFEFERGLFKFTLNTPALAPLFQLPPQIGKRSSPFPKIQIALFLAVIFFLLCLSHRIHPATGHLAYLFEVVIDDFKILE